MAARENPGKTFNTDADDAAIANAVAAGGDAAAAAAAVNALIEQIEAYGSDAELHAQSTAPFEDSDGNDFEKGAKGWNADAQNAKTAAQLAETNAETWAEGSDAAVFALGGTKSSQGHAEDAAEEAAAAEVSRLATVNVVRGFGGRETMAAGDALFQMPAPPSLSTQNAGTQWTTTATPGSGTIIGAQPNGFDYVEFEVDPDNSSGTLTGFWVAVRRATSGGPVAGPPIAFKYYKHDDIRRPTTLGAVLPFWIQHDDNPTYWIEYHLVGKSAKAWGTNGAGAGRYRFTGEVAAEWDGETLPAFTAQSPAAMQVKLGQLRPTQGRAPHLTEEARRVLEREGFGSSAQRVRVVEDAQAAFVDPGLVWAENAGSQVGYLETFAPGEHAGLSAPGTMFSTYVDLGTLTRGINGLLMALVLDDEPVTLVRAIALRTDIDGSGGKLFDTRDAVTTEAGRINYVPLVLDVREEGRAVVGSNLVQILVVTDKAARFPYGTGFTGADSYVGNVAGAIFMDEPWKALNAVPIANAKGYLRIGRVEATAPSRDYFWAPGEQQLAKAVPIHGRVTTKMRRILQDGSYTLGGQEIRFGVGGFGPSGEAQPGRWKAIAQWWTTLMPSLVVGMGYVTPWNEKNESSPGAVVVDTTDAPPNRVASLLTPGPDDGRGTAPDGSVRLWAAGDAVRYTGTIKRFFLWVDGNPDNAASWNIYDEDDGDALVATVLQDEHGDGPFVACVTFPTLAERTVRIERPAGDTGETLYARTLMVYGDTGGLTPELSFAKFAKGGAGLDDWERVIEERDGFPCGRLPRCFELQSVAAAFGETGLTANVAAPVPDLFRLLPSQLQDLAPGASRSTLARYRDLAKRFLHCLAEGSAVGWGYRENLTNAAPSDLLVEVHANPADREPSWAARAIMHEAARTLHTAKVGILDMGDTLTEAGDPLGYLDSSDLHMTPRGFWRRTYDELLYCLLPPGAGSLIPLPTLPPQPTSVPPEYANVTISPDPITAGDTFAAEWDLTDVDGTIASQIALFADRLPDTGPTETTPGHYEAEWEDVPAGEWNLYMTGLDDDGLEAIYDHLNQTGEPITVLPDGGAGITDLTYTP